jgi:hypothetical protein
MRRRKRLARTSDLILNTDLLGTSQTDPSEGSSRPVFTALYRGIPFLPCLAALAARFIARDASLLVSFLAGLAIFPVLLRFHEPLADWFFPLPVGSVAPSSTLISENISPCGF